LKFACAIKGCACSREACADFYSGFRIARANGDEFEQGRFVSYDPGYFHRFGGVRHRHHPNADFDSGACDFDPVPHKLVCKLQTFSVNKGIPDFDDKAQAYLQLACLGIIGDIVPLKNENRLIVQRG
jgi:single-stranded DNA-specific DHH superfamily exonuclease